MKKTPEVITTGEAVNISPPAEETPRLQVPVDLVLSAEQVIKDPAYRQGESFEFQDDKDGGLLVFEGVHHAGSPERIEEDKRMMERIKKRLEEIIKRSQEQGKEPFVIIEGGAWEVPTSEEEALKSEMLYTAFLAEKAGVAWESPEPSDAQQVDFLLKKGYSAERIISTFVMRQLKGRVARVEDGKDFEESATFLIREHVDLLDQLKPHWELPKGKFPKETYRESVQTWFDYYQGLSGAEREHEERVFQAFASKLGQAFIKAVMEDVAKADGMELMILMEGDRVILDTKKVSDYTHLYDDRIWQLSTNKISADMQRYRDEKIVTEIAKAKASGKNVFVVFGSYHATAQKPALKRLYHQEDK